MTDRNSLPERLRGADAPNRELWREIFATCCPEPPYGPLEGTPEWVKWSRDKAKFGAFVSADAWIDAAVLLLPPDVVWWNVGKTCADDSPLRHFGSSHGPWCARVSRAWGDFGLLVNATHPATAIVLAALAARGIE